MANAYLRLTEAPYKCNKREESFRNRLSLKDLVRTGSEGNKAMEGACVFIQRRNNWSAVARIIRVIYGLSTIVVQTRTLSGPWWPANHDRSSGEEVSSTSGGWQEEGFDWGTHPRNYAIHLPVDQLEPHSPDVLDAMKKCYIRMKHRGRGISQEHRNGYSEWSCTNMINTMAHTAPVNSFHFFDGVIVCLASDIENTKQWISYRNNHLPACSKKMMLDITIGKIIGRNGKLDRSHRNRLLCSLLPRSKNFLRNTT